MRAESSRFKRTSACTFFKIAVLIDSRGKLSFVKQRSALEENRMKFFASRIAGSWLRREIGNERTNGRFEICSSRDFDVLVARTTEVDFAGGRIPGSSLDYFLVEAGKWLGLWRTHTRLMKLPSSPKTSKFASSQSLNVPVVGTNYALHVNYVQRRIFADNASAPRLFPPSEFLTSRPVDP